jgi:hypothetical protein
LTGNITNKVLAGFITSCGGKIYNSNDGTVSCNTDEIVMLSSSLEFNPYNILNTEGKSGI